MLPSPKESAPVITKTANRFEVLYNLNEDGPREKSEGKSIQFRINSSNKKNSDHL